MSIRVVDTNVAIAANGRDTHADALCQLACIEALEEVVKRKKIAVDDQGLILDEYSGYLNHSGAPGVGDKFYKHVFNNQYIKERCVRVAIHPVADTRVFREFPGSPSLTGFDRSDRKFVAVALTAGGPVPILNATDSDWANYNAALVAEGVSVIQLCPQHAQREG
jgi:hypothetical protein